MILFLKNTNDGTRIYKSNFKYTNLSNSLNYNIEKLCNKFLFSYNGYKKALKLKLNLKSLQPLYLNKNLILIPIKNIKDYHNLFINFKAITSIIKIDNSNTKLFFNTGETLIINKNINFFYDKEKEITKIENYLNSLKL